MRSLAVMLDTCTKCGNCMRQCHSYLGTGDYHNFPAARADLVRRLYRRHFTLLGPLAGPPRGGRGFRCPDHRALGDLLLPVQRVPPLRGVLPVRHRYGRGHDRRAPHSHLDRRGPQVHAGRGGQPPQDRQQHGHPQAGLDRLGRVPAGRTEGGDRPGDRHPCRQARQPHPVRPLVGRLLQQCRYDARRGEAVPRPGSRLDDLVGVAGGGQFRPLVPLAGDARAQPPASRDGRGAGRRVGRAGRVRPRLAGGPLGQRRSQRAGALPTAARAGVCRPEPGPPHLAATAPPRGLARTVQLRPWRRDHRAAPADLAGHRRGTGGTDPQRARELLLRRRLRHPHGRDDGHPPEAGPPQGRTGAGRRAARLPGRALLDLQGPVAARDETLWPGRTGHRRNPGPVGKSHCFESTSGEIK